MTQKAWKPKVDIIKVEAIVPNVDYAFTANPCDDYQYFEKDEMEARIKSVQLYLQSYFIKCNAVIGAWGEVSSKGRLHIHGTIKFHSQKHIYAFFVEDIHRMLRKCTMEIDTISDENVWSTYCRKQMLFRVGTTDADIKRLKYKYTSSGVIGDKKRGEF